MEKTYEDTKFEDLCIGYEYVNESLDYINSLDMKLITRK